MSVGLDLDGTLLDARRRQVEVARSLVPDLDGEDFWARKREGATTRELLGDEAAAAWVAAVEEPQWLALDVLLPGVADALRDVEAGFVLTARRDARAVREQVARHIGLPVEVVDPFDAAAQKAAVLQQRAASVYIGDTESDAKAAQLAGVPFVAVSTGQRSERFLRAAGVEVICASLAEALQASTSSS
jgi:phosphoglycolate phosphatase-like HAD superfamily hydrolase